MIRPRRAQHANHERWLVSYADFITLMFAFFVVLFASSHVDRRKAGRMAQQMQESFAKFGVLDGSNGVAGEPVRVGPPGAEKVAKQLEEQLRKEIARKDVSLKMRRDGLVITLHEGGFFDSGSATLKPAALEALVTIAGTLAESNSPVRVEGHTDNQPIHTSRFDTNWELSTARATEIVKYFVMAQGLPPERFSAAGYAEFHPVAGNETAEGRSQNRRVDLVVLGGTTPEEHAPTTRVGAHFER